MKCLLLIAVISAFTASCSFTNVASYQVLNTNDIDRKVIAENLSAIAGGLEMEDHKNKSDAENTISLHVKPRDKENWYVEMGARQKNQDSIIDLFAGYGPKIPRFEKAKKQVEDFLKKDFSGRYEKTRYEFATREQGSAHQSTTRSKSEF